jgi:hypothetical protein
MRGISIRTIKAFDSRRRTERRDRRFPLNRRSEPRLSESTRDSAHNRVL